MSVIQSVGNLLTTYLFITGERKEPLPIQRLSIQLVSNYLRLTSASDTCFSPASFIPIPHYPVCLVNH